MNQNHWNWMRFGGVRQLGRSGHIYRKENRAHRRSKVEIDIFILRPPKNVTTLES
jgi:hypothetical protein